MTLLDRLSDLLAVRLDEVECVLRTDASRARSTVRMQRRGFLGAAAALAAAPFVPQVFVETPASPVLGVLDYYNQELTGVSFVLNKGQQVLTIRERVHQPFWDTLVALSTLSPEIQATLDELAAHSLFAR